jgi:serine/threonine protein kinase
MLSLCSASKETENKKAILVMPFIQEGSVKNFNWFNGDKFNVLKSIIQQTVISLTIAYNKCGFIHNDLHLDNILLKKTKKETIKYQMNNNCNGNDTNEITIKTYGYKSIIMDFDSSMINIDNKSKNGYEYFWKNIYNMISRIETDLKNKQNASVSVSNMKKIVTYILDQQTINIFKLLEMIDMMQFKIVEPPKTLYKYDPNVF